MTAAAFIINPPHEMSLKEMEDLKHHYLDEMKSLNDSRRGIILLNEIISQLPLSIAITPVLSNLEPEDSFIMGNEELNTIPKKESDEFIKSSVEELVPIPSDSEDTSECL
ncbi:hypothetical protein Tco_0870511 [Tanacetum coccineum]